MHRCGTAIVLALIGAIGLASCASEPEASEPQPAVEEQIEEQQHDDGSDDDASSGVTDRSGVIMLVESQYAAFDAAARWDDDTLVVTMEGDADDELEWRAVCSLLEGLTGGLNDAQVEFPNGTHDC